MPYFRTRQALRYQQDTVQSVVVSRFARTLDLLLQSDHDRSRIGYSQRFHNPS